MFNDAVQDTMKLVMCLCVLLTSQLGACASAPAPAPASVEPWPERVSERCPDREIALECFRGSGVPRAAIDAAVRSLIDDIQACVRPDALPLQMSLMVETLGGAPTCVDASVRDNPIARCTASLVARKLRIPGALPEETCSFRYPFRFELKDDKEAP